MGITGLDQRQTAGTGLPAQHIHGVLDRDGIYFAEECIRQGQDLQLQLAGSFGVALKPCLAAVVHQLRLDIGDHTDDTLAAQRQQGNHLIIVARVDVQLVTAQLSDLGHLRDVAGGLLDAVDERIPAQLQRCLGGDVQAGTGRHIIQDNRDAARLGHSGKVGHQTCLRGLVVIGGHKQQGIGTAGSRLCCQCTAVIGIIGTSTRNNRHPVIDRLDRKLDGGQLLLIGHGRAFAGSSADHNSIGAPCNLIFNDAAQLIKVDAAIFVHGGDDRHRRAGKDRILHSIKLLCTLRQECVVQSK